MALWAEALGDVEPMPGRQRPKPASATASELGPPPSGSGPRPAKRIPVAGRLAEADRRRLGRSGQRFDAKFDLHGYGHDRGREALLRFLRAACDRGCAVVLVVTGKSERRDRPTTFRREVPMWLGLPEFSAMVSAFDTAHARHGGEGALYVRLRRRA